MVALDRLPTGVLVAVLACVISAAAAGSIAYRYAEAQGKTNLSNLAAQQAEQALAAERANRLQLLQQVTRANEAEALLLTTFDRHAEEKRQLQERIPHVTTNYIPAPGAVAKSIPRCVFTAGWLRDFNTALGVPAPGPGTAVTTAEKAAWPTPGTDTELLESGVTPADILAHAQDYGVWARANLAQLNALLDLQEKD
ncbi:lysis protein [Pseudomonas protegens]|uniref:Lysis protein n=1 Tax=Pseudomonas protegens TaxID=380021 RepID=A0A7G7XCW8_9PSED|nr:lysis protein [Pseudomonas protegens]QNH77813.1 lysis protein [Pseudomonas protegens]QNL07009.1 lysis protein [Pseudomonas protegens]